MHRDGHEETVLSLNEECSTLFDEARMVLPGVQALFGFQLIAVFSADFHARLDTAQRVAHLVGIGSVVIATALLMAPAAFHRIVLRRRVSRRFVELASRSFTLGMAALGVGLSVEVGLVTSVVLRPAVWGWIAFGIAFCVLFGLWFALPWTQRPHRPS